MNKGDRVEIVLSSKASLPESYVGKRGTVVDLSDGVGFYSSVSVFLDGAFCPRTFFKMHVEVMDAVERLGELAP